MKVLFSYLKPYRKACIIGPFFKLLEAILELLLPTVMALIINHGVTNNDPHYILKYGSLMLLMSLLGFVASCICQFNAAKASQGYGTDLRNALFTHINSFSYKELDNFGTPTLLTRLTNDVGQLQLAVAMLIRLVVRAPFICIGAIIMAMILNFKLSLILIATAPIFVLILYLITSKTSPLYKLCQQKLDKLNSILRENLSGIRVIRAFTKSSEEKKRFDAQSDDLTLATIRVAKLSALLSPITTFILNVAIIMILWVSGLQINVGKFTPGGIIAYINYVTQALLALIVVSNLVIIFTKAYTSAGRVSEILTTTPTIVNPVNPITTLQPHSEKSNTPIIEFSNVSFSYYEHADNVLDSINLKIYENETVGVIGSTGAGKTTLVNLMGRLYDVTKGEVLLYNNPLMAYDLTTLHGLIGYVPQKSSLISGTIMDNLKLGNPNALEVDVVAATKVAQAYDFITALPNGYNTTVTRGGQNFSGGQKQRLAIARALIKKPRILVLDDSASALDFTTESTLRHALQETATDLTTLIISQRISSIKHCNRIIVMDDGKIVAVDSHENLLRHCTLYQSIYASQTPSVEHIKGGSYA
ncbi:MAG: ABC transporter ATP-binding protein [Cellulosilyticaceae bacterium]